MKPDPALETRLADLVRQLTAPEKIGLIPTRQEAVPRLGLTEFWIGGEAAHGLVARDGPTTVFPQTLGLSATWDPALVEKIGAVAGDEARAYHKLREGLSGLCLWAPTVDLERDPRWGRTEEGWGEDPVLTGILASAYVRGMQGRHPKYLKTVATLKHFFANNHEKDRTSTSSQVPPGLRDRYYLKAFELVLKHGQAQSIMTAYNAVNGVPAMLLAEINEVVRGQWRWDGFVVCDGGALSLLVSDHKAFATWAEAVAASLKAGVDCFPEDGAQLKPALAEALDRGLITEADLDRAVTRTLRARLRLGLFAEPGDNPYEALTTTLIHRPESRTLAREAAVKAAVLLKNDGVLPLSDRALGSVAVIGPLADVVYRDWYSGTAAAPVSPLKALVERLGTDRVVTADGCDLVALRAPDGRYIGIAGWNDPSLVADRPSVQAGELYRRTDWGWGTQTFQALANGNFVTTDDTKIEASAKEVWGWFTRERFDAASAGPGPWLTWRGDPVTVGPTGRLVVAEAGTPPPPFTVEVVRDGLRGAVAAARNAEAAVVFVGSHPLINGRECEDRPSLALAPDQVELIRAVAKTNPQTVVVIVGSYPFAIGDWQDEVGAVLFTTHGGQEAGHAVADLLFGDAAPGGRLSMTWYQGCDDLPAITDYDIETRGRTHLYYQGTPLYPFGHGLSYTTFAYKGLRWDSEAEEASVVVTNTGSRTGDEVVQFYQGRVLVGFARITLVPGENRLVRCPLPRSAVGPHALSFSVGSSSTDLRLTLEPQGML